jgi:hypothetical protein
MIDLVIISKIAILVAQSNRPVMMKLIKKVSTDAAIRQDIALKRDLDLFTLSSKRPILKLFHILS